VIGHTLKFHFASYVQTEISR